MICPHRSEYIGKPKWRYSTDMAQQEHSQTGMLLLGQTFYKHRNTSYDDDLCSNG